MRVPVSVGLAIALVLTVIGCGAGHTAPPKPRSLARLVLQVSEAPPGTRYVPQISGAGILVHQGLSAQALKKLRARGFESDFGRQFYSTNTRKGLFSAGSGAARFRTAKGAAQGLEVIRAELRKVHPQAVPVSVAGLGNEGWGYGGRLFSNAPSTYRAFYLAWRQRDLLFTVSMSGPKRIVTLAATRALAEKVAARARGS